MSQTIAKKAVEKLRHELKPRRKLKNPQGPEGRLYKIRQTVTALIKHERIELNYNRGDESRGYAERLISEAIRYGENHKETMELASFWLLEHQLVHKLFKVLVPRYQDCKYSYTKMWKAPQTYPYTTFEKCVLELRHNVYPNLVPNLSSNHLLLHNLLLDEARKEYEREQEALEVKLKKNSSTQKVDSVPQGEVKEMEKSGNLNSADEKGDSDKKDLTSDK